MLKAIFLISLPLISMLSHADTISCGGKFVTVSDVTSAKEPFFSVTIEGNSTSSTHLFQIQNDFLHLRCEVTATGNHVVLINNFCGGSGCADFGNFGIIEISTGKVLLEPNQRYKGNMEQAKGIIGTEPNPFACELKSIEICLHSKIELGKQATSAAIGATEPAIVDPCQKNNLHRIGRTINGDAVMVCNLYWHRIMEELLA